MINIRITVTGPGQCIDSEYYLILRALKHAGYNVEEDNPYPNDNPDACKPMPKITAIKLIAKHEPWGG